MGGGKSNCCGLARVRCNLVSPDWEACWPSLTDFKTSRLVIFRVQGHTGAVKIPIGGALTLLFSVLCVGAVEFETDVLPILKSHCFKCHIDGKEKGDFNLEPHQIKEHIGAGLQIVPGRPNSGLFMKVILSDDPDNRMPPKGAGLGEKDVNILKLWITQGAEVGPRESVTRGKEPLEGVWTNKSGKKIKAALLGVEEGKALLKLSNGKIYKYPIVNLDAESQRKVREFAEMDE